MDHIVDLDVAKGDRLIVRIKDSGVRSQSQLRGILDTAKINSTVVYNKLWKKPEQNLLPINLIIR